MADFAFEYDRAQERVIQRKGKVVRKTVIDLFQRVVNESPFDTGRFKGNWQVSFDSPAMGELDRLDPTGAQAQAEIVSKVTLAEDPLEMEVWLVNNLPYAVPLEYGHSDQAPQGMVRVNVMQFPQIMAKYIRQEEGF